MLYSLLQQHRCKPADDESKKISALREALSVPFDTLERYSDYVTDNTRFATHQGVKGLEFSRVMVVMDDAEAKGPKPRVLCKTPIVRPKFNFT